MSSTGYVELRCRSAFSFLRGASLPEDLIERAAALGYDALALGDRHGVYGAPRFFTAARRAGVRALVGAEVVVADAGTLALLVEDRTGYAKPLPPAHRRGGRPCQGRGAGDLGAGRGARRRAALPRRRRRGAARGDAGGPSPRSAAGHLPRSARRRRAPPSRARRRAARPPPRRSRRRARRARRRHQRRAAHDARRPAAARRPHLHPPRHHARPRRTAPARQRRAPSQVARRDGGAVPRLPRRRAPEPPHRRALRVHARRPRYRFPDYPLPPGETPIGFLRELTDEGARER